MSKQLFIPQAFGTLSGTAQTGYLDTDFTAVATFCNDPASKLAYADDIGGANAVSFTLSPAIVTLSQYITVWFKAAANNTGATTLTVSPVPGTTKALKRISAASGSIVDLVAKDIVAGGIYGAIYQASADIWILINPSSINDSNAIHTGDSAGGDLTGTYPSPILNSILSAGGPIGNSSTVPVITWDAKGRLTTVSSQPITVAPVVYISNGTYIPSSTGYVYVTVVGGGGGGGGGANDPNNAGGGGGGSGQVITDIVPVTAGVGVTVTIGGGGGGGDADYAGVNGVASAFGILSAAGGRGGQPGSGNIGGAGGADGNQKGIALGTPGANGGGTGGVAGKGMGGGGGGGGSAGGAGGEGALGGAGGSPSGNKGGGGGGAGTLLNQYAGGNGGSASPGATANGRGGGGGGGAGFDARSGGAGGDGLVIVVRV